MMLRDARLVLLSAALLVTGCQQAKRPGLPPMAKVAGTVSLDGKPMEGGVVRFNAIGQPAQSAEITSGEFSGNACIGPNQVDVVWEKDGPPNPMDPTIAIKVNVVSDRFSGGKSPFKVEVGQEGQTDLKFEVTSAGK